MAKRSVAALWHGVVVMVHIRRREHELRQMGTVRRKVGRVDARIAQFLPALTACDLDPVGLLQDAEQEPGSWR